MLFALISTEEMSQ